MAWAGTGALFTVSGGLASSISLDQAMAAPAKAKGFTFLQVSDSHVGFAKPANLDAKATYQEAVNKIAADTTRLAQRPSSLRAISASDLPPRRTEAASTSMSWTAPASVTPITSHNKPGK